jgi:UDP-sugar transporter A1/2/3
MATSSTLLLLYVFCETIRANYAYFAFHSLPQLSASVVSLLSELLKLAIAAFFLARSNNVFSPQTLWSCIQILRDGDVDYRRTLRFALPAGLYLINNLIYYTVLPHTDPTLLQVCVLAKLPTTGILHHYMIKKQRNVYAWFSLLGLCIGLAIFNIPTDHKIVGGATSAWYLAPVAGFVIACLSALANIFSETSTKEGEFWESQALLYSWGVLFATIACPLAPSTNRSSAGSVPPGTLQTVTTVAFLVLVTSGTGLVVAVVLRARDNILKVIGTAASLITISISQYILLPELRASTFTKWRVLGGGIVTTTTWCYNHYSQEPWHSKSWTYETLPTSNHDPTSDNSEVSSTSEGFDEEPKRVSPAPSSNAGSIFRPDATKILMCAMVTGFLTMEVALKAD